MSDKAADGPGFLTKYAVFFVGGFTALWITEHTYMEAGGSPFLFCASNNMLDMMGVKGWYAVITYGCCALAVFDGATRGIKHSVRWLCLVALLCSIPVWLDQGFRHGQRCDAVLERALPYVHQYDVPE